MLAQAGTVEEHYSLYADIVRRQQHGGTSGEQHGGTSAEPVGSFCDGSLGRQRLRAERARGSSPGLGLKGRCVMERTGRVKEDLRCVA